MDDTVGRDLLATLVSVASTPETPQAIELGLLLKRFRVRAGLSQQALAARLNVSHSDVSRRETGKQGLDDTRLGAHLGALGVTDAELEQAVAIHSAAPNRNWTAAGIDRQVAVVSEYEAAATRITNVQPSLIPGPLQTRSWAIELGRRAGASTEEAERSADFRTARSEQILNGSVPFHAFIGEYALRYPACDTDVAVEQLQHLVEVSRLPHVSIRAVGLRKRYTALRAGSFVLIELAESAVVHLEQLASSTTLTDERYVKAYVEAATNLRSEAMSLAATERLIAQLIDEMERT
jgi:transcriptional regulator with XRE-family HTH domain